VLEATDNFVIVHTIFKKEILMENPYRLAQFLQSGTKLSQLPSGGIEVAFVGRSNAGKSSVLNTLTQQKGLAKTSKTPGRTQLINVFTIGHKDKHPKERLIDLPGYGYAKVPEQVKQQWQQMLHQYLEEREELKGLIIIMDIRHPLKELDEAMISWGIDSHLQIHLLLNKADKISKSEANATWMQIKKKYANYQMVSSQLFSATTGFGLKELISKMRELFYENSEASENLEELESLNPNSEHFENPEDFDGFEGFDEDQNNRS
jgi:GTP-binding protein